MKIGDIKGTFHRRMGMIKDRNGKDLTEAEEIKKDGKNTHNYTRNVYMKLHKKGLNDPDNHDDAVTHLEPDVWEYEVK